MASGYAQGPELDTGFHEIGLFNNASDGSHLVVWDVTISAKVFGNVDGSTTRTGFNLYQWTGFPYTGSATPINPSAPQPWGAVFFNSDPTVLPYTFGYGPQFWGPLNWEWPHAWPIAIVPPNWIFSCAIDLETGDAVGAFASYFWEITKPV